MKARPSDEIVGERRRRRRRRRRSSPRPRRRSAPTCSRAPPGRRDACSRWRRRRHCRASPCAFAMNHMVAAWRSSRPFFSGFDEGRQRRVVAVLLDEVADLVEEGGDRAAAVLAAACGRRGRAPGCRWRPRRSWRCARRGRTAPCRSRRCSRAPPNTCCAATALSKPRSVRTPLTTGVSRPSRSSAAWRAACVGRAERDVGVERGRERQRAGGDVEAPDRERACGGRRDGR